MDIIKRNAEISELFTTERIINRQHIRLLISKKDEKHDLNGRVAFIAGKKLGTACLRTKAKRRMRGLCRDLNGPWKGYDVLFVAKQSTATAPYRELVNACKQILKDKHVI